MTDTRSNPARRTRLDDFQQARDRLGASYQRLIGLAASPDWPELTPYRELLEEGKAMLEEEAFQVIVFGEFKHGKSTFMNALLERELCPTSVTPETAKISRIHHAPGKKEVFRVVGKNLPQGDQPLNDLNALRDYVGQGGRFTSNVREIDIFVDGTGTPLESGAVFVDTPGLRSVFDDHDRITEEYVKKADAIIFFFDGLKPFTQDERNFLRSHPEVSHGKGTLYVLNRIDQITNGEAGLAQVEGHVREQLQKLGIKLQEEEGRFPQLFPISAKAAFDSQKKGQRNERFERLRKFLAIALANQKGVIIVDGAVKKQEQALVVIDAALRRAEQALGKSEEERKALERHRHEWNEQLAIAREGGSKIATMIAAGIGEVEEEYLLAVDAFIARLKTAVRRQVKNADDADDLQEEIPALISDKCREWSEEREEALGKRLRRVRDSAEEAMRAFQVKLEKQLADALELEGEDVDGDGVDDGIGIPFPAGGAGAAGAGIGFAVGGPVGAAIGGALGILLGGIFGWFSSKDWQDEAWEYFEEQIDSKVRLPSRRRRSAVPLQGGDDLEAFGEDEVGGSHRRPGEGGRGDFRRRSEEVCRDRSDSKGTGREAEAHRPRARGRGRCQGVLERG